MLQPDLREEYQIMKKEIVGILVCMLLIAAAVLPVAGTMNINEIHEEETTTESDSSQDSNSVKPDSNPKPIILYPLLQASLQDLYHLRP